MLQPKIATFGKYRLVYRKLGSGPPLMLVHGLSGSSAWWRRNVPAFTPHFTVYNVELVGYGSNRAWRPVTIQQTADVLHQFIDQIPHERTHIVGHSMGGQIVTHLAANNPDCVDRLVLASASGMIKTDILRMMLRLPSAGRYSRFDFAPVLTFDALRAGPLNLLLSALDILSNDVSEALSKITAPTLLIWGEHDTLVPVAVGQAVHEAIKGSRLEIIPRAGHVPMWDEPTLFNQLVLDFLKQPIAQPVSV